MDADVIRLILFLAGIALVVGIYLWDRYKKNDIRIHAVRKLPPEEPTTRAQRKPQEKRKEPVWEEQADPAESDQTGDEASDLDQELERLGALVQEGPVVKGDVTELGEQTTFAFGQDEPRPASDLDKDIPVKILQLNIVARHGRLPGEKIMQIVDQLKLEAGDMQIFHHYEGPAGQGRINFSMASLVEPGTFPLKDMTGFSTPGLTLFAQLPGPKDGLAIFSDMLETAQRLAAALDGELEDETHSDLSRQTIEHMREEIIEHQRQVRLATSRR